ncbi:MAG TPA: 4-oxalocrotonate tautomerase [Propionibacterium sp.]|jgi:4-oxalocrotonate tautomerase|nr:4-oxalocrotonate tautomerase [Propionibacterium sp.]
MPIVEVTLTEGRTPEKLRAMISGLTRAVVESGVARPEQVRVMIRELPRTHFAVADETFAERDLRLERERTEPEPPST